jgi:hypothetical protein
MATREHDDQEERQERNGRMVRQSIEGKGGDSRAGPGRHDPAKPVQPPRGRNQDDDREDNEHPRLEDGAPSEPPPDRAERASPENVTDRYRHRVR